MKPLRIEIQTSECRHRPVPNKQDPSRPYDFYEQSALLHGLVSHGTQIEAPVAMVLSTPKDKPFAPGMYTISPESYDVNRFGQLEMKRILVLEPVAAQLQKAA